MSKNTLTTPDEIREFCVRLINNAFWENSEKGLLFIYEMSGFLSKTVKFKFSQTQRWEETAIELDGNLVDVVRKLKQFLESIKESDEQCEIKRNLFIRISFLFIRLQYDLMGNKLRIEKRRAIFSRIQKQPVSDIAKIQTLLNNCFAVLSDFLYAAIRRALIRIKPINKIRSEVIVFAEKIDELKQLAGNFFEVEAPKDFRAEPSQSLIYLRVAARLKQIERRDVYNAFLHSKINRTTERELQVALERINSKHKISSIIAKYQLMLSLTGIDNGIDKAFLKSTAARRAMVTTGSMIWYSDELDPDSSPRVNKFQIANVRDMSQPDDYSRDVKQFLEILLGNKIVTIETSDSRGKYQRTLAVKQKDVLYFWGGVGMVIPENVNLLLGFNQVYPEVHIVFNQENDTGERQVIIEEYAWDAIMLASPSMIDKNVPFDTREEVRKKFPEEWEDNITGQEFGEAPVHEFDSVRWGKLLNFEASTEKTGYIPTKVGAGADGLVRFNIVRDSSDFLDITVPIVPNTDECEINVVLPYAPPMANQLTRVTFGNGSPNDDDPRDFMLLTTC
ncbi:MAG: hypothetical protein AAGN35_19405 [Bacteroidota bacterium]